MDPYLRELWGNKHLSIPIDSSDPVAPRGDLTNTYSVNKYGYRSKEFSAGDDILFAGCSVTYGSGVPENSIWGNVVANTLGMSASCIATPGDSVDSIISQLFSYFAEYGNPKYLLCLFPDPFRIKFPVDITTLDIPGTNKHQDPNSIGADGKYFTTIMSAHRSQFDADVRIIKKPFDPRVLVTEDVAVYSSIRSIRFLEQYCKATGIQLLWSSWQDRVYPEIFRSTEPSHRFEYFFDLSDYVNFFRKEERDYEYVLFSTPEELDACRSKHVDTYCSCGLDCHSELVGKYSPENFNIGMDRVDGSRYAHPGTHLQAHFAEAFLDNLAARMK